MNTLEPEQNNKLRNIENKLKVINELMLTDACESIEINKNHIIIRRNTNKQNYIL